MLVSLLGRKVASIISKGGDHFCNLLYQLTDIFPVPLLLSEGDTVLLAVEVDSRSQSTMLEIPRMLLQGQEMDDAVLSTFAPSVRPDMLLKMR